MKIRLLRFSRMRSALRQVRIAIGALTLALAAEDAVARAAADLLRAPTNAVAAAARPGLPALLVDDAGVEKIPAG